MKEEDKDLNYWKENARESYMKTPICVLRYITELEKEVKNLTIPVVVDSEAQLKAFREWYDHLSVEEDNMYEGRYEEVFLSL